MNGLKHQRRLNRESGLTIVELMISLFIVLMFAVGIGARYQTLQKSLQNVSRLMALDAFEASLIDFMRSELVLAHSFSKASSIAIKKCFVDKTFCLNGQVFPMNLYREGQRLAFTGTGVNYDRNAQICPGECAHGSMYQVKTSVSAHCVGTATCVGPAYVLVTAEIYAAGKPTPVRKIVQEVEKVGNRKYPGVTIECSNPDGVLYGVGLQGEALCVPISEVVLKDQEQKKFEAVAVAPVDCSTLNMRADDQFFLNEISAEGKIICAPRFW